MMYLIEPQLLRNPHYRGRHWQFIGQSLQDLQHAAAALGHRIEVLEGDAVDVFTEVHRKLGIKRLLLRRDRPRSDLPARPIRSQVLPISGYRVVRIPNQWRRARPAGSKRLESVMAPVYDR